jgi:hypothetical protein
MSPLAYFVGIWKSRGRRARLQRRWLNLLALTPAVGGLSVAILRDFLNQSRSFAVRRRRNQG